MRLLGVAGTRELDRRAVQDHGLPVRALMEVAGGALARHALALRGAGAAAGGPILFLCGGGHNGGDGLAAARHASAAGAEARVLLWADPARLDPAPAANLALLGAAAVPVVERPGPEALERELARAALVVDCLLGTGFRPPVRDPLPAVIAAVNGCGRPVLAADVPSGLSGDVGRGPEGPCVRATATLCFAAVKAGVFAPPGRVWAGRVACEPLGLPAAAWAGLDVLEGLEDGRVAAMLPRRAPDGHKGTFGTVAVLAGSVGYAGAAALCAEATLRAGAGLARVLCPAPIQAVLASRVAEATSLALPADAAGGVDASLAAAAVDRALVDVRAVVAGPGLGRGGGVRPVVERVLASFAGPVVLDADALNALDPPAIAAARGAVVVTPHPGEAARLLGCRPADVQADRLAAARRLAAEARCVAVLKGAGTLIASPDGRTAVSPTGNDGMATGGTGDVLAGLLAGLLAQGAAPWEAACAAVFVHGRAGDLAAAALGRRALVAGDVLARVGEAFRSLEGAEA